MELVWQPAFQACANKATVVTPGFRYRFTPGYHQLSLRDIRSGHGIS